MLESKNLDKLTKQKRCDRQPTDRAHQCVKSIGHAQLAQIVIANIDRLLSEQMNAILHHPDFQRLEASWRGLYYLVSQASSQSSLVKIRILDIKCLEIVKDLDKAIEFDHSQLFAKIYSSEFDSPGGEPFGLLIGDYKVSHKLKWGKHALHIEALKELSKIASAAFTPFVAAADPSLFGLDDFSELQPTINLARTFVLKEYQRWKNLREQEDARFVGLVLPHVLMRLPYRNNNRRNDKFCFSETTKSSKSYLWGHSVYAFAAVVLRAFSQNGWFADIHGAARDKLNGGMVDGLPHPNSGMEKNNFFNKPASEVCIHFTQEKLLSDLGFIPLCGSQYNDMNVFYSSQSIQRPVLYSKGAASNNEKLSAKLNYMLCVSRFAHYIKVIFRNKIGTFFTTEECEDYLNKWLRHYTADGSDLRSEMRASYPLRESSVQVNEQAGKVGHYYCILHLRPQYQFEQFDVTMSLKTNL